MWRRSFALALGALVPADAIAQSARTNLCASTETVLFSCRSGQKLVSVCAAKDAGARKGYLEYRFGDPAAGAPELVLPKERTVPAQAATGAVDAFAGGGGSWLKFRQGPFSYTVFSGIGNWGPSGEKREKAGVLVERAGKQVALLKCAGKYASELGPDLYEKFDIKPGDEAFDYPD